LGTIYLRRINKIQALEDKNSPFAISLTCPERVYVIYAHGIEEQSAWCNSIQSLTISISPSIEGMQITKQGWLTKQGGGYKVFFFFFFFVFFSLSNRDFLFNNINI